VKWYVCETGMIQSLQKARSEVACDGNDPKPAKGQE